MNIIKLSGFLFIVSMLSTTIAHARTRIAVLNFELNDITSLPNIATELKRTASMAPLLSETLSQIDNYELVSIDNNTQKSSNASFGYLFHFHDLAAQLGQKYAADWIIVSQHSKPSFLFSYLWVYLIDVKKQKAIARYDIELKGNHDSVTKHAIAALTKKLHLTINKTSHP
ncbi:MAG: DUF2380 domain-containing protein [Methylomonas lenta]|nr:DUF2380 domain-containing protein [Methylomonas lenta]